MSAPYFFYIPMYITFIHKQMTLYRKAEKPVK